MIPRSTAALWAVIAVLVLLIVQSFGHLVPNDAPLGSFAGSHSAAGKPPVCRDGNFDNDPPGKC